MRRWRDSKQPNTDLPEARQPRRPRCAGHVARTATAGFDHGLHGQQCGACCAAVLPQMVGPPFCAAPSASPFATLGSFRQRRKGLGDLDCRLQRQREIPRSTKRQTAPFMKGGRQREIRCAAPASPMPATVPVCSLPHLLLIHSCPAAAAQRSPSATENPRRWRDSKQPKTENCGAGRTAPLR